VNAEFGYRTATEIFRYIAQAKKNDDTDDKLSEDDIVDSAIVQKLLPKLHGSRKKLEPVLYKLWELCLPKEKREIVDMVRENVDKANYKESADKILRMYLSANANGFTSFAEA
jgi:5-methylcytosine-specific restriction protein B